MKSSQALLLATALAFTTAMYAADKTEKNVALKNADGQFVIISAGGGLTYVAKDGGQKSTFTLTDLNGATLDDGDEIRLKYTPEPSPDAGKNKPSYWAEKEGAVTRWPTQQPEGSTFKLKSKDGKFLIQGASGKSIKKSAVGLPLGTTDSAEEAAVFEVIERTAP